MKNLTKILLQPLIINALSFLFLKIYIRLKQNNICIDVFKYENKHLYPICILKEKFENHMELLLVGNEDESQSNKSHYVYVQ